MLRSRLMEKIRPKLNDSPGWRCHLKSLRYAAVVPNWPAGASTQAFGFNTRSFVGSMQWQFGSFNNRGWPGTLFQKVVPPPQLAGLFDGPRPNCDNKLLFDAGTAISSPLW